MRDACLTGDRNRRGIDGRRLALRVEVQRVGLGAADRGEQRGRGGVERIRARASVEPDGNQPAEIRTRRQRIVAAESEHDEVLGRADVHVDVPEIAQERDALTVRRGAHDLVAVRPVELQCVIAVPALVQVVAVAGIPDHQVVARTADVGLEAGATRSAGERVVACRAVERVEAGAAVDAVVSVAPRERVVAIATVDAQRRERGQPGAAGHRVVAGQGVGEHDLGGADVDRDGARVAEERDPLPVGRDRHRVVTGAAVELERVVDRLRRPPVRCRRRGSRSSDRRRDRRGADRRRVRR